MTIHEDPFKQLVIDAIEELKGSNPLVRLAWEVGCVWGIETKPGNLDDSDGAIKEKK